MIDDQNYIIDKDTLHVKGLAQLENALLFTGWKLILSVTVSYVIVIIKLKFTKGISQVFYKDD